MKIALDGKTIINSRETVTIALVILEYFCEEIGELKAFGEFIDKINPKRPADWWRGKPRKKLTKKENEQLKEAMEKLFKEIK
jgi:hypothetical protein